MKQLRQSPYIHIFDFAVALLIIACGIYALYLIFTGPDEGGSLRSAIQPIGLGILTILFGLYHFRFALQRYRERK